MEIIVQVRPHVSLDLHGKRKPILATDDLRRAINELGIGFDSIHPNIDDPQLMRYFRIEVPNQEEADRIIMRLKDVSCVEAAYSKPAPEPP